MNNVGLNKAAEKPRLFSARKGLHNFIFILSGISYAARVGCYARLLFHIHIRRLPVVSEISRNTPPFKRFRHYYFGATFLFIVFYRIIDKKILTEENKLLILTAALSACFDDLTDRVSLLDISGPESFGRVHADGSPALKLWVEILKRLPEDRKNKFIAHAHQVFSVESSVSAARTFEELQAVSVQKGGYSVCLFRTLPSTPATPQEEAAVFQFGAFVQCCDDLLDIWFDRRDGIPTFAVLAAESSDLEKLQRVFEERYAAVKFAYLALPRGAEALKIIDGLAAVAKVCLFRYRRFIEKYGFLPLEKRDLMVTDMSKWGNRFRWLYYLWKF